MRCQAAHSSLEVMKGAMRWGAALPETYVNYGLALLVAKRHEEALRAFDQALAMDKMHVNARYNRAAALNALEKYDEALVALDALLKDVPNHQQAAASRKKLAERLKKA